MKYFDDSITSYKLNDILALIKCLAHVPEEDLNPAGLLNLKNGLYEIETRQFIPHDPAVLSTIQLNVFHDESAKHDLWLKTLNEIFEADEEKINLLQEYFGLCLTRETKYEKSLFLIGEGANGKSVLLHILSFILGSTNYSAIPLEKFSNPHYIANLFGVLANISIETHAKAEVYDSVFKATVSGDMLEADRKFQAPFKFSPFCKLIFALNNMPRVDDKSDAFYRRLIILPFNRQFKEEEQNKDLKHELEKEINGIFQWSLQGLYRLKKRGNFVLPTVIKDLIEDYRKENNNVKLYVEDICILALNKTIGKALLYEAYVRWCRNNGHRSLSLHKFSKELKRQYSVISEYRDSATRYWQGITVQNSPEEYMAIENIFG